MKINSLRALKSWSGKIVFLRVDFNVTAVNGRIKDDLKIIAGLETIKFLLAKQARVIIATHFGEPDGCFVPEYSAKSLASRLQKLLGQPVKFISETVGAKASRAAANLKNGEVIFLENLRFNKGELDNDPQFAQALAKLADVYVNDAFAVSHRDQASLSAIKKFLPAYAGLLLEREVLALNKILKPQKPLVVIMGGAKINNYTKAPLIAKLLPFASQVLIGGAIANNFFKLQKLEIGLSLNDPDSARAIKNFYSGCRLNPKIILPLDVVVKTKQGRARCCLIKDVRRTEIILDIGPQTISLFAAYIKKAATIIWNGPMGKYEVDSFRQGSLSVARLVAARSQGAAYGLVGGGETIEVLKLTKMAEYVDWISTAGGAMLTYLGGGVMPGLVKLVVK